MLYVTHSIPYFPYKKTPQACKPEVIPLRVLVKVVLILELLNTTTAVDELLLTCKERMARRADIKSHFFFRRSGDKSISTCASYFTFLILRMDSFLHAFTSFLLRYNPVHNLFRYAYTAVILYHTGPEYAITFLPVFHRFRRFVSSIQEPPLPPS